MKKYDKNTLGNSPASIYLVDLLNNSENKKDASVLRYITKFKSIFNQLVSAYEAGSIDSNVVKVFCQYKRADLDANVEPMIKEGFSPVVINLYKNIVVAEMKKFERNANMVEKVEKSAIDRAKSTLKNKKVSFKEQTVPTFGRTGNLKDELYEVQVVFDKNGLPKLDKPVDPKLITQDITDESLMKKSLIRRERNKKN